MKVFYVSDLHLENQENPLETAVYKDAVLVIAGDVKGKGRAAEVIDSIADNWKYIVWTPGNHDWYDLAIDEKHKHQSKKSNVFCLQNTGIVLDGIEFVGGTGWVPVSAADEYEWRQTMNDPKYIRGPKWRRLTATHISIEFIKAQNFFMGEKAAKKRVLVTHHPLCIESLDPRYIDDPANKFYAVDAAEPLKRFNHYIHGHVHSRFEYEKNGCHVHCNPRGYRSEYLPFDLKSFEI